MHQVEKPSQSVVWVAVIREVKSETSMTGGVREATDINAKHSWLAKCCALNKG